MHDLNDALDELRHVIPYAHSPSVRKLSKIATLLLAKNYILMQTNALNELRRVLICMHQHSGASIPQTLSASVAALLGNSGNVPAVDQLVKHDSWSPGGATVAPVSASLPGGARTHLRGVNEHEAAVSSSAAVLTTMASSGLNSIASSATAAATAVATTTTTALPSSKNVHQAGKLVDEQQTISVQNRRRKYNMLINRILGDVATQHLVNPLQYPHTSPMSINSHKSNLRPIDFCTSQGKAFSGSVSGGGGGGFGGNNDDMSSVNRNRRSCGSQIKRKSQVDHRSFMSKSRGGKQVRLTSGDSARDNMASGTANSTLDETSSLSSRSSETSCSSLVSVGSPQFKSQHQVIEEHTSVNTRSHSASTIVSFDEETSETPALETNKQSIERVHLST